MRVLHKRRRQLHAQARIPPAVAQPRRTTSAHSARRSGRRWGSPHVAALHVQKTILRSLCFCNPVLQLDYNCRGGSFRVASCRMTSRPPSRLPSTEGHMPRPPSRLPSAEGHVPLARLASSASRASRRSGGYVQEDDGDDPAQAGAGGAGRAGGGGRVARQLLYSELLSRPGGPWAWLEVRTPAFGVHSVAERLARLDDGCAAECGPDWWAGRQRPAGRERVRATGACAHARILSRMHACVVKHIRARVLFCGCIGACVGKRAHLSRDACRGAGGWRWCSGAACLH